MTPTGFQLLTGVLLTLPLQQRSRALDTTMHSVTVRHPGFGRGQLRGARHG